MSDHEDRFLPFTDDADDLANGGDLDVDPSDAGQGEMVVEINQIVHGGSCDVKFLADVDGDGNYEIVETIDSFSGAGVSQGNELQLHEGAGHALRITNTSGGAADYSVAGRVLSGAER